MTMAVVLMVLAVGCVMVAVPLMLQFDRASSGNRRLVVSVASVLPAPGSRARRRADRKASPVLFIMLSGLTLLVIAALV